MYLPRDRTIGAHGDEETKGSTFERTGQEALYLKSPCSDRQVTVLIKLRDGEIGERMD